MNEWIFLTHLALIIGFLLAALRLGAGALTAFVVLQAILANLFVIKQIHLFGLEVTCSDAFAVGGLLALNLLQEFFGKEAAKKAIKNSLFAMLFFMAMAKIHLLYSPNAIDHTHGAFAQIFSPMPRIIFASIGVFFLVQRLDIQLFGWMQRRFSGQHFALRVTLSLFISQSIDTVLFSFAGLYGMVASVFDVIAMSLPIKWVAIACSAPFAHFCKYARQGGS